jgi:hypothetical protein
VSVSWGNEAEAKLDSIALAVADELRRNAEEILHDIPPVAYKGDEGDFPDGSMWHSGAAHERLSEEDESLSEEDESLSEEDGGPQNYVFLYRRQDSNPEFEILAVLSNKEMARLYVRKFMPPELSF